MKYLAFVDTPVGRLTLSADENAITDLFLDPHCLPWLELRETPLLVQGRKQLTEYFAGTRREFSLPLAPSGTPFQRRVWDELLKIPYGATSSYGQIAQLIENSNAYQAVGSACGDNPIPILIPCHRVLAADDSLSGYRGGLPMKEALLRLEGSLK